MSNTPVVQLDGVSKKFGLNWALREVSLTIEPGEIHGLLGQNGSGKSTLIKILAGFHAPDGGTLAINGDLVTLPLSSNDIRQHKLRFVHQDLALVPSLSVADNFLLETLVERRPLMPMRDRRARRKVEQVLRSWDVDVDAEQPVESLSRLDRAKLAIVRAVTPLEDGAQGALLVLDEPTAFLPPDAARSLFQTMRRVADRGAGVLFVSHNLEEIMEHTDRATVLRDGQLVGTVTVSRSRVEDIVEMILGRPGPERATQVAGAATERVVVAGVKDLRATRLGPLSFDVGRGEVLGVAGLIGSGFERILDLLYGVEPAAGGTLSIGDDRYDLESMSPRRSVRRGIGFVPAERLTDGCAPTLTVAENVTAYIAPALAGTLGSLRAGTVRDKSRALTDPLDVRPANPDLPIQALSGGNQQKAVLAKWLGVEPRLLLISEPTQGVDVGARAQIGEVLDTIAGSGCAVVCASSDLDQLVELCTRVVVVRQGQIVAEVTGADLTKHNLMMALFNDSGRSRPPTALEDIS